MRKKKPQKVVRPKADVKKIHCRNEFELCYLRHQYFRRVDYNPTAEDMKPYAHIAVRFAGKTFFMNRPLMMTVGLEREDIINIANVHLVSFLGLFSLEKMPEKYKDFVKTFKQYQSVKPKKEDVLDKNQANFTMFLKQRMEDLVRVCRQKARNVKGLPADTYLYYYGKEKPPKNLNDLVKDHEKYGYRKLDPAVFRTLKKRNNIDDGSIFLLNETYYLAVPVQKKSLTIDDFNGADLNPCDSIHNMNPEEVYFTLEDNKLWIERREEFDSKPDNVRLNMIKNFINMHKDKQAFKDEVSTAEKLLRTWNE